MNPKPTSVEEYFSWFPLEIQSKLRQIQETLKAALPDAKEVISYHMPAFKTTEVLVYYAAAKNHLATILQTLVWRNLRRNWRAT